MKKKRKEPNWLKVEKLDCKIYSLFFVLFFLEDLGFCHFLVRLVQKCLRLHIYKFWSNQKPVFFFLLLYSELMALP